MSNKKPRGKSRDNERRKEKRKNDMRKILIAKKNKDRVLKYDDPILQRLCHDVGPTDDLSFIKDMKDILKTSKNGVGLSANQIGILKRVIVIDPKKNKNYMVLVNADFTAIEEKSTVNPEAEPVVKECKFEEGCLSYPNFYTKISRPRKIEVTYYDENRKMQTMICEDFKSILVQHEIDHTYGICKVGEAWQTKQEKMKRLTQQGTITDEEKVAVVENKI